MSAHHSQRNRVASALVACAASAVVATASSCSFGRAYAPSRSQRLIAPDARALAAQRVGADGELPLEYCRKACAHDIEYETEGCHVTILAVVDTTPSQWSKAAAPPVGTKLIECHESMRGGSDLIIR